MHTMHGLLDMHKGVSGTHLNLVFYLTSEAWQDDSDVPAILHKLGKSVFLQLEGKLMMYTLSSRET